MFVDRRGDAWLHAESSESTTCSRQRRGERARVARRHGTCVLFCCTMDRREWLGGIAVGIPKCLDVHALRHADVGVEVVKDEAASINSHMREIDAPRGRDDFGFQTHPDGSVGGVCNVIVVEDEELDTIGSVNAAALTGDTAAAAMSCHA